MTRIDQIEKAFYPQDKESQIYQMWLDKDCFKAKVDTNKKPYTIMMPPPNITGQLHMGHALDNTLQDALIRYKRLQGFEALWQPGTDHASIATETKIVESLKAEGLNKLSMGREKFLERAWAWKEQYGNQITEQLKRLGASCDWSRERFTLDEGLSKAVRRVFINLYNENLIYRGERIINWCPTCRTSISDAEVEYQEQNGYFWHLRYPLKDGSDSLVLATTRPETMLGDTAVAVHPDDKRYQHLIGKTLILPLVEREIPIIADDYVDQTFGTGVVKITPAHDPNDFEVGLRHQLPIINVMTEDAKINENGGVYQGLSREAARDAIVQDLTAQGYMIKKEEHQHNVGTCYRCHTIVEPRVSLQWFVKMNTLAQPAIQAVKAGDTEFIPDRFAKIYYNWMENIRDWCISRQLWWGHRIPAYYCEHCHEVVVAEAKPTECPNCAQHDFKQDEDTLDTWFSSALWPFSTLGWPDETPELSYFYPTDVLVTAYDIIFFWVARMIFSGLKQMKQAPFHTVYIHGIIRDNQGRKMSKSLNNGINPLEIIDEYGADALRYALVHGTAPGNDQRYEENKVLAGRNFINKIWNAFRFIVMNFDEEMNFQAVSAASFTIEDRWILTELQHLITEVNQNLEKYELGIALTKVHTFLWESFCDWYIEICKLRLYDKENPTRLTAQFVLNKVLVDALHLLHPFLPFVTEDIYKNLIHQDGLLISSQWPEVDQELNFPKEHKQMEILISAVRELRNLRKEMNVSPKQVISLFVLAKNQEGEAILADGAPFLKKQGNLNQINFIQQKVDVPDNSVSIIFSAGELFIPLGELMDVAKEIERLEKEKANFTNEVERLQKKLGNKGFTDKAPEKVVLIEKDKLLKYQEMLTSTEQRIQELKKMSALS